MRSNHSSVSMPRVFPGGLLAQVFMFVAGNQSSEISFRLCKTLYSIKAAELNNTGRTKGRDEQRLKRVREGEIDRLKRRREKREERRRRRENAKLAENNTK